MAVQHPDIMLGLSTAASPERVFAEEAFRLLGSFAVPNSMRMDQMRLVYPTTDPVEMIPENSASKLAMRLRGMPTFSGDRGDDFEPSDNYYVMELQYGEANKQFDSRAPVEQWFDWLSYVVIVIDTEDLDDISVLNGKTGEELDVADLGRAQFNLQAMRDKLRSEHFVESIVMSDVQPQFVRLNKGYAEFDSQDFLDLGGCEPCGTENVPCKHNPFTLN